MDTRIACMGILSRGDASGYDIRKRVSEDFAQMVDVSQSAVYPALAKLLAEGLVSVRIVQQDTKPNKKIYSLTSAGRAAFAEALREANERHHIRSEVLFKLLYADILSDLHVKRVLDKYVESTQASVQQARELLASEDKANGPGERFVAGFVEAVAKASIDYVKENRDWLEAESSTLSEAAQ